jgi:hypothetical protein
VKISRRAVSRAFIVNYKLFTEFSHAHLDDNWFHKVALILPVISPQNNLQREGRWTC